MCAVQVMSLFGEASVHAGRVEGERDAAAEDASLHQQALAAAAAALAEQQSAGSEELERVGRHAAERAQVQQQALDEQRAAAAAELAAADEKHVEAAVAQDRQHADAETAMRVKHAVAEAALEKQLATSEQRHAEKVAAQDKRHAVAVAGVETRHAGAESRLHAESAALSDRLAAMTVQTSEAQRLRADQLAAADERHAQAAAEQHITAEQRYTAAEQRHADARRAAAAQLAAAELRHAETAAAEKDQLAKAAAARLAAVEAKHVAESAELAAELADMEHRQSGLIEHAAEEHAAAEHVIEAKHAADRVSLGVELAAAEAKAVEREKALQAMVREHQAAVAALRADHGEQAAVAAREAEDRGDSRLAALRTAHSTQLEALQVHAVDAAKQAEVDGQMASERLAEVEQQHATGLQQLQAALVERLLLRSIRTGLQSLFGQWALSTRQAVMRNRREQLLASALQRLRVGAAFRKWSCAASGAVHARLQDEAAAGRAAAGKAAENTRLAARSAAELQRALHQKRDIDFQWAAKHRALEAALEAVAAANSGAVAREASLRAEMVERDRDMQAVLATWLGPLGGVSKAPVQMAAQAGCSLLLVRMLLRPSAAVRGLCVRNWRAWTVVQLARAGRLALAVSKLGRLRLRPCIVAWRSVTRSAALFARRAVPRLRRRLLRWVWARWVGVARLADRLACATDRRARHGLLGALRRWVTATAEWQEAAMREAGAAELEQLVLARIDRKQVR